MIALLMRAVRTLRLVAGKGLAVAVTLLMLSSLEVAAGESGLWRNSGDWQIRVDSSLGRSANDTVDWRSH